MKIILLIRFYRNIRCRTEIKANGSEEKRRTVFVSVKNITNGLWPEPKAPQDFCGKSTLCRANEGGTRFKRFLHGTIRDHTKAGGRNEGSGQ
ncbi:hypothetical protein RUM43_009200, partial [Polyplax serrata]